MVIAKALTLGAEKLQKAGVSTPRLDAEVLLGAAMGKERLYFSLHKDEEVPSPAEEVFHTYLARRAQKEPVAYILGEKEFMSLPFSVCPGVLIPRPDTETVVEVVLQALRQDTAPYILDACSGSGAIGVSLAHYLPQSQVFAIDKEPVCVSVTQTNAKANGVQERFLVKEADVFTFSPEEKFGISAFDCVVSNPPYIPQGVIPTLEKDVKDYEPLGALAGGDDGLLFYRHLISKAPQWLNPGGLLVFEIGYDQGQAVASLIRETERFTPPAIVRDLGGCDRVVWARLQ